MNKTQRWIAAVALTIVVALVTNLGAIPFQWTNSFEIDQSSTVQGFYQSGILLNSTIFDLGSTVSGNATFPGFRYQSSSQSPVLYILSPSQFTTWESSTPLAQPKVTTETLQPIIDFQQNLASFKFSFTTKEGGTYYYLMSSTGYTPPTYAGKPSLTYSATTLTPPPWYRLIAALVPVFYLVGSKLVEYRIVRADSLASIPGEKGKLRQMKVQELFEAILGPLDTLESGIARGSPFAAWKEFLRSLQTGLVDRIRGLKPAIDKETPEASSKLFELLNRLGKETDGFWEVRTSGEEFVGDPAVKKLVSATKSVVEKWLDDHA